MGPPNETLFEGAGWDDNQQPYIPAWPLDSLGDYFEDQDERSVIEEVNEIMLQRARRLIWHSHRQNLPQFAVVCEPTLDLAEGRAIHTPWLDAVGKVYALEHRWNLDEDNAYDLTLITLACPRGAGGTSDALGAPAAPDTGPTHAAPTGGETLPTRIGNTDIAPDMDEAWVGYTGNYETPQGTPTEDQKYQDRFRAVGPDIEAEARDELSADTLVTYAAAVPDVALSITPNPP